MNTVNPEHNEGQVASAIEEQTAKIPSDIFLWAAIGSMAISLTLKMARRQHTSYSLGNGLRRSFFSASIISL